MPVISSEVSIMYPDGFYLQEIYPLVYLQFTPIMPVNPLVPIFFVPEVKAVPAVFYGDSIQVAKYVYGDNGKNYRNGLISWPSRIYSGIIKSIFLTFFSSIKGMGRCESKWIEGPPHSPIQPTGFPVSTSRA